MSKKRQAGVAPQPIAAPAQTTNPTTLSLASPLKIQFDSDSQLRITVVTPEKPPAPLNRWIHPNQFAVRGMPAFPVVGVVGYRSKPAIVCQCRFDCWKIGLRSKLWMFLRHA